MNKKKKIIVIGALPPPYIGPTLATEVIISSSLSKDFELYHLDSSDHRGIETFGKIDFWNIYLPIKSYFKLTFLLIVQKPDLVYIPISQTTIGYLKDSVYILISKVFRKKVLCHLRGGNFKNWLESASKLTVCYVKNVHKYVDGQIVLGKKLIPLFESIVPISRIHVVPNGKDVEVQRSNEKDHQKLRILFLSNLIESKGVLDVLYSLPLVIDQFPNVNFEFVGGWFEEDTKQKFFEFLEENPDLPVIVFGVLQGEEKAQALNRADLFIFPTFYPPEGHPWVVIEAMANGLPIITTDQGAITESVIDGVNGFIVEKNNPKMIARKLLVLAQNESLRVGMGSESRKKYLENFTEIKMVENLKRAINATMSPG